MFVHADIIQLETHPTLIKVLKGWLELGVPGFKRLEEMPPPLLVIWMVQERKLAVELLMIQTGTLLESSDVKLVVVNQPLELGAEFRTDKELVCTMNFLLESHWSACQT